MPRVKGNRLRQVQRYDASDPNDATTTAEDASPKPSTREATVSSTISLELAWYGRRFGAFLVDLYILIAGAFLLGRAVRWVCTQLSPSTAVTLSLVWLVVAGLGCLAYFAVMESSTWQATLGKRLFSIKVLRFKTVSLSIWRALVRNALKSVSICILYSLMLIWVSFAVAIIRMSAPPPALELPVARPALVTLYLAVLFVAYLLGYLSLGAFIVNRRALHDWLTGTCVVHWPPKTEEPGSASLSHVHRSRSDIFTEGVARDLTSSRFMSVIAAPFVIALLFVWWPAEWTSSRWLTSAGQAQTRQPESKYLQRRAAFKTRLIYRGPSPQRWQREQPPPGVQSITYESGDLALKAWVYVPQTESEGTHPALVYFHGGFAFGSGALEVCRPFIQEGFVVMTPTLRGENGNPGNFELFWGEVDDAKAAVQWLAKRPYVDPQHIYCFGHSVGGGISALLSLHDDVPIRHGGSSGGLYDVHTLDAWREIVPFDLRDPRESLLRVLPGNTQDMRHAHWAYIGQTDYAFHDAVRAVRRPPSKLKVILVRGDHHSSLPYAVRYYLNVVKEDLDNQTMTDKNPGDPEGREP